MSETIMPQLSAPEMLPLLGSTGSDIPVAWWRGEPVYRDTFSAHVQRVAAWLPGRRYAINLCSNRYLLMVSFAAVILRGQTNLLPPDSSERQIREVAAAYPDQITLQDADIEPLLRLQPVSDTPPLPDIPADLLAALVFTSGSTGRAQAHPKYWGSLVRGAQLADRRFRFANAATTMVVATVPAQHMYGLETSIMMPLTCAVGAHAGQPFYAQDIRMALADVECRRVLVTTPMHLRVCVESGMEWPAVDFIISATAPLSVELADRAEQAFACPVMEIYGCTEAGSLASRRTIEGPHWQTYDELSIRQRNNEFEVLGGHLPQPVVLHDRLALLNDHSFELIGRQADMVNIAGKRASLADLTLKLNEIEGVEDGVFMKPVADPESTCTARLIALVVAPELHEKQILDKLARSINPAFMPRPLYRVSQLPRNDLGKLPHTELLKLLKELQQEKHDTASG